MSLHCRIQNGLPKLCGAPEIGSKGEKELRRVKITFLEYFSVFSGIF
jgi:hypothetical protein